MQNVLDISKIKDFDGKFALAVLADQFYQVNTAITAHANGTQAGAVGDATVLLVSKGINVVGTVATTADSVALPLVPAPPTGQGAGPTVGWVIVANLGANSMTVYGSGTDTINGVATATGVAQAANTIALYIPMTTGTAARWLRVLGG